MNVSAAPTLGGDGFDTTAWSLVLAASSGGREQEALERLCRKHWRPIYIFVRRSGLSPLDAEDVTQDFFVYLLDKQWLQKADPNRGSFRAYLLTLLRNFLANQRRGLRTEKGRAAAATLSLDAGLAERDLAGWLSSGEDPVRAYDASWARDILRAAWDRLDQEQRREGEDATYEALKPFVTRSPEAGDYERLSRSLGMRRGQVALLIHRLSRRFAESIRAEVAETLNDPAELEVELRHLLAVSAYSAQ